MFIFLRERMSEQTNNNKYMMMLPQNININRYDRYLIKIMSIHNKKKSEG